MDSRDPRYGDTFVKHGRLWRKAFINFPIAPKWTCCTQNNWWLDGVELINKGYTYACMYVWDSETRNFSTWDRVREKFILLAMEAGDWAMLTYKLLG